MGGQDGRRVPRWRPRQGERAHRGSPHRSRLPAAWRLSRQRSPACARCLRHCRPGRRRGRGCRDRLPARGIRPQPRGRCCSSFWAPRRRSRSEDEADGSRSPTRSPRTWKPSTRKQLRTRGRSPNSKLGCWNPAPGSPGPSWPTSSPPNTGEAGTPGHLPRGPSIVSSARSPGQSGGTVGYFASRSPSSER